jgi:hypothetical protein
MGKLIAQWPGWSVAVSLVGTRPPGRNKESRAMAKRLDSGSARRRVLCAYGWQHGFLEGILSPWFSAR